MLIRVRVVNIDGIRNPEYDLLLNVGNIAACWETGFTINRRTVTAIKLLQPMVMQEEGLPDWIEKEKPVDFLTVRETLDEIGRKCGLA